MTQEYIESTCGLTNGVRFEQLEVKSFDSSNFPIVYNVVKSFECYNPGVEGAQKFWPDKIYFDKPNGHYLWSVDTSSNGIYIKNGPWRNRLQNEVYDIDSIIVAKKSDSPGVIVNYEQVISRTSIKPGPNPQSICPIKFKSKTWYFLNFYDQRYQAYLYIDDKMNFNIHKISLPTNF